MKRLYNRRGVRRGDGERSQFAFFLTGAIVVLAVVFVIGIQAGRVIEKHAASKEVASGKAGGAIVVGKDRGEEIGREIGSFPGGAGKADASPGSSPEERVRDTERSVTFRETLERKEAVPPKLTVSPPERTSSSPKRDAAASGSRLYVQAAAFRKREGAEAMQKRLRAAGFPSIISPAMAGSSGMIHRVLVGPFAGNRDAGTAREKIAEEFRTRPYLVRH